MSTNRDSRNQHPEAKEVRHAHTLEMVKRSVKQRTINGVEEHQKKEADKIRLEMKNDK